MEPSTERAIQSVLEKGKMTAEELDTLVENTIRRAEEEGVPAGMTLDDMLFMAIQEVEKPRALAFMTAAWHLTRAVMPFAALSLLFWSIYQLIQRHWLIGIPSLLLFCVFGNWAARKKWHGGDKSSAEAEKTGGNESTPRGRRGQG